MSTLQVSTDARGAARMQDQERVFDHALVYDVHRFCLVYRIDHVLYCTLCSSHSWSHRGVLLTKHSPAAPCVQPNKHQPFVCPAACVLGDPCAVRAVAGLSKQQLAALQGPQPSSSPAAANHHHSSSPGSAAAAAASQASLLRSLPVGVLADPSPSRPQAGVVLSVAPLLGAHPYADPQVGKWLHVHVRPSVRGLLRIIKVRQVQYVRAM